MRTPLDAMKTLIGTWEGLFQANPNDRGNYVGGKLVGTMRGVTPATYAKWAGVPLNSVTAEMLKKSVTLDVAAEIGARDFYDRTDLPKLKWGPVVEVLLDIAWMSGIDRSLQILQNALTVDPDGKVGPGTLRAYAAFLAKHGEDSLVNALADARIAFLKTISRPGTPNFVFQNGWLRRAEWFRPNNPHWWTLWYPEKDKKA